MRIPGHTLPDAHLRLGVALLLLAPGIIGAATAAEVGVPGWGGFEGGPEAVAQVGWRLGDGVTVETGEAAEGEAYLRCGVIESAKPTSATLRGIKVRPHSGYIARCRIRLEGGAHFTFGLLNPDGSFFVSKDLYAGRTAHWDEVVLPFRTEGHEELAFYLGRRYGNAAVLYDAVELVADDTVRIGDISPSPNPFPEPSAVERRRGYIISAQHWMRPAHPAYFPTRQEVAGRIDCRLAPGEYGPVTFSLTGLRDLSGMAVRLEGDLRAAHGATLDARAVSIGIVRAMKRYLSNAAPLQPGQRYERRPMFIFPNQPFDVPARETLTVWLTVHASPDAVPGAYEGRLRISGEGIPDEVLPLGVEVLPIRLLEPDITYGMYYRHDHQAPEYQTEEFFRRSMADMKAHGMNSVSVYANVERKRPDGTWEIDLDLEGARYGLNRQMRLLREARLLSPAHPLLLLATGIYDGRFFHEERLVQAVEAQRRANDWPELLFYLVDEPGTDARIALAKELNDTVHRVPGVRTTTALGQPRELADYYDVWIVSTSVPEIDDVLALGREKNKEVWTYNCQWNGCEPRNDRYFTGYYMWATGLRGNWQWAYTEQVAGSANLAEDLPLKLPYYEEPWYVTYVLPTPEGNIPTLGWEARREGVDDYRYLHTLRAAVAEARRSPDRSLRRAAWEADRWLRSVAERARRPLQPMPASNIDRNYAYIMHPGLTPEDHDDMRQTAAAHIMRLTGR